MRLDLISLLFDRRGRGQCSCHGCCDWRWKRSVLCVRQCQALSCCLTSYLKNVSVLKYTYVERQALQAGLGHLFLHVDSHQLPVVSFVLPYSVNQRIGGWRRCRAGQLSLYRVYHSLCFFSCTTLFFSLSPVLPFPPSVEDVLYHEGKVDLCVRVWGGARMWFSGGGGR